MGEHVRDNKTAEIITFLHKTESDSYRSEAFLITSNKWQQ